MELLGDFRFYPYLCKTHPLQLIYVDRTIEFFLFCCSISIILSHLYYLNSCNRYLSLSYSCYYTQ